MIKSTAVLSFALLMFGVVADASADLGIQAGVESFRWREYGASGAQLLEESGPRFHVGVDWRLPIGADRHWLLETQGSLYYGKVDYDGQACTLTGTCRPFVSKSEYSGATGEITMAWRFDGDSGGEIFGGGGLDIWERSIKGDATVQGGTEDWSTINLLAGGGWYWTTPGV